MLELIIIWVVMSAVVAIVADSKGLDWPAWFFYGLMLWPIALTHAIVMEKTPEKLQKQAGQRGKMACPYCAEMINAQASICRFCNKDVKKDRCESSDSGPQAMPLPTQDHTINQNITHKETTDIVADVVGTICFLAFLGLFLFGGMFVIALFVKTLN